MVEESAVSAWRKTLVTEGATIRQVIQNLDDSALQIALVVTAEGVLAGTITDGDIRRGLLRGLDMESPIKRVVHRDPLVVPPEMDREMVLHLMRVNKINRIPVVDSNRRVIGLHLWNEMERPVERPNTMVIMAGGKGMRMRPNTENCPKPLLPVAGRPMLAHIIERAGLEGFRHFTLAVHYLGHMIEEYFGDGTRFQVSISYIREKTPLGTAGALGLLESRPSAPIVVSNGDVLTGVRYGELLDFHTRHGACATMAVRLYEWQHPFGVVRTKGLEIIGFEEKPVYRSHVNAGFYVLEPEALDYLERGGFCDMPSLFQRLRENNKKVIVYPIHEPWIDVGRLSDFEQANRSFEEGRAEET